MRSNNKLINDLENVKAKLNRIGNPNKSYDDVVQNIRMNHSKQMMADKMLNNETKTDFPFYGYALIFLMVMVFTTGLFFVVADPSITGAVIEEVSDVISNKLVTTAIGMLTIIIILGMVLHHVDYKHKTRYDKYKNPKMLER